MILFLIFGVALVLGVYLIPSIIAAKSNHPNKGTIIALNILAGWTFIVWVISLVWALTKSPEKSPVYFVQNGNVISEQQPQSVVKEGINKPIQSQQNESHKTIPSSQKNTAPLRPQIRENTWPDREIPKYYSSVDVNKPDTSPKLVGISGQYAGQKVDLGSGKVSIGRDPSIANLIYPHSFKDISRKHCTVSYDPDRKSFFIEDDSTNGTFLFPQNRLKQGQPVQINNGTRFFLSDPSEQYEVKME
jgi:hypothetical protein